MAENTRHIEVEGGFNIRDLGGYPTQDGRVTRWHTLIRSGGLDRITPAGQQRLIDYGVKTVIDLRDDLEIHDYPDVFAHVDNAIGVGSVNLPLSRDGFASSSTYTHLGELYVQYLSAFQDNIAKIVAAISAGEPAVLFHCAVGKDRTGLISALLLDLVGVPEQIIADDYAMTTQHIAPVVAQWRANARQNGHDLDRFERDVASEADSMLYLLNILDTKYGGAASYLRSCGVTDEQLLHLQTRLLAP